MAFTAELEDCGPPAPGSTAAWTRAEGRPGSAARQASPADSSVKRAFDCTCAALIIIALAPLLLLVALAIALDSRGPVLFRQQRTGLGGSPFRIAKFRTMRVVEDGDIIRQAQRVDPRITRVGAFLRRSSLDELPQLFNVLTGDMSLIGPRPHALAHDREFARLVETYDQRFRARPGITGLAQASGLRGEIHSVDQLARRIALDNAYIDQWSFRSDLLIFIKTIGVFAFHKGAY